MFGKRSLQNEQHGQPLDKRAGLPIQAAEMSGLPTKTNGRLGTTDAGTTAPQVKEAAPVPQHAPRKTVQDGPPAGPRIHW
jgi:hypothetical protein